MSINLNLDKAVQDRLIYLFGMMCSALEQGHEAAVGEFTKSVAMMTAAYVQLQPVCRQLEASTQPMKKDQGQAHVHPRFPTKSTPPPSPTVNTDVPGPLPPGVTITKIGSHGKIGQ